MLESLNKLMKEEHLQMIFYKRKKLINKKNKMMSFRK